MPRVAARDMVAALFAVTLFCASLLAPAPLRAAPDFALIELDQRLRSLSDLLHEDATARRLPLAQLLFRSGLDGLTSELPKPGFGAHDARRSLAAEPASEPPAHASVETFRTALALLAQVQGSQDNLDLLLAHPGGKTDALTIRGGVVTLDRIRQMLRATGLQQDMRAGQDVLRVPVVLWEDTVLRLGPHDRLKLSRPDGAFIISFGRVEIDRARISSQGGPHATSKDFVPFLTIAGGGSLQAYGASFEGLGFGNTPKFSGVSVVAHALMPSTGPTRIVGSHFEDVQTLSIAGTNGTLVSKNRFYDMRHNALLLSSALNARLEGNLFFGDGPTNAIRVLAGSDRAVVRGNVLLEGDRSGILVQGSSDRVEVGGNVIWRRSGGAIKFSRTRCGILRDNVVLNSRQKGVDIRSSDGVQIDGNTISGSGSAGIWVSAQPLKAQTLISSNTLRGNEAGLATATGGEILLVGNDFSNQMPRLVDGDITPRNRDFARDLHGRAPMILTAAETRFPDALTAPECDAGAWQ
ncbi:right-handed parallel beta-helix repeat-containing protein [Primorskyibacter sp. 2E107]|uniref:right-handed parallel beta-helix repeat-containing protein n=1 Tax=Primorskyibacter sp. 2E107 TaxID=3403458 RepID=UPI003AF86F36